ncbi:MAG: hypothetical protein ABI721_03605 [Candidatus Dojkabacteria bacterium]
MDDMFKDNPDNLIAGTFSITRNATEKERGVIERVGRGSFDVLSARNELEEHELLLIESTSPLQPGHLNYQIMRKSLDTQGKPLEFDPSIIHRYNVWNLISESSNLTPEKAREFARSRVKTPDQIINELLESDTPQNIPDGKKLREQYEKDIENLAVVMANWLATMTFELPRETGNKPRRNPYAGL